MKIYTQYIFLFVCFSFVARVGISQNVLHTSYPIIFVHGIVGDETTWTDNEDGFSINPNNGIWDIIDFLHSGDTPLESGGFINISLDYSRNESQLNTFKEADVHLFTTSLAKKDIYFINFAVGAKDGNLFKSGGNLSDVTEKTISNSLTNFNVEHSGNFKINDLVCVDQEIMKIINIQGSELVVERGKCNTNITKHSQTVKIIPILIFPYFITKTFPIRVYNLYKESNQAAIAKQGLGIKKAIDAVKSATGAQKVILVGHSMGGLAIREYIRTYFPARQDVAKIVTIGTPHYGSNLAVVYESVIPFDIMGMDDRSDAIRDLKSGGDDFFSGLIWGHLNTYLFGGNEANVPDRFYSKDINCNGSNEDYIHGVNDFNYSPFPNNIARTWITSTIVKSGISWDNDGIVLKNSQYIYSGDTIMTHDGHTSLIGQLLADSHLGESKDIYALIRGMDEPDDQALAYEIEDNSDIKGFITYQEENDETDIDLFKLVIKNDGLLKISMLGNNSSGVKAIDLLDSNSDIITLITDINGTISESVKAGIYYVWITGIATSTSYQYPYTLKTRFEAAPPTAMSVSSTSLQYYDVVINAPKQKTVKLTNNGTKDILITGISLSGTDASQFTVTPLPPFTVKPGQSSDITVKFNPTTTGAKMAAIEITTNAPDIPTKTISLKGNATDHETKFLVCSVTNSYNYGNVRTSTNKTKTFIIQNTGSNDCEISDLSIEGLNPDAYAITAPVVKTFTLSSGESTKITVQFSPASVGVKNAYLSVLNNSDNVSPKDSIELYGNGIENFYTGANTNIVAYEYWFDDNYTSRVYTSITPQQYFSLNTTFSTNELTAGLHRLQIRYRDSKGKWSAVISEVFHKMPIAPSGTRKITQYEYWFDNEYSSRVTTSVEPQQVYILNSGIDAIALPVGLHTFHTRFKDDASQWSSVVTEVFYKLRVSLTLPNLIVGYRYWFDLDNSTLKSVSLPVPVNPYHLVKDISTCGLTGGDHTIHFQFKDTNQAWSSVVTDTFNIELLAIPVITAKGATTFCEGGSVTLSSSSAGSYLWNNSATTQDISVTNSGSYFVSAGNGCNGSLASEAITITVNPFPLFPETPAGPDTVDLQITFNTQYTIPGVSYADSYIWNLVPESAGEISGSDVTGTVNWNPNYLGFASIKAMSVNSCGQSALSVEKQTYVDNTTSIANNELASLKIFPNPNNGSFYINSSKPLNRVIIRDVLGKIFDQTNYPSNNQLFEYRLNEGVYLVHIFMNDKEFIRKIIVKKER